MFETRRLSSKIVIQAVLTFLAVLYILPLVQAVSASFAGKGWGNYEAIFATGMVPTFFRNSVFLSAGAIAIVVTMTLLAAFGFSKLRIRGKEIFFWGLLVALTLPEVVLLVPLFLTTQRLGLFNTLLSVMLPLAALQIPFATLLTRNFFDGVPNELLEAGRIDGANIVQVFCHIVVPLTKPIIAAIVVLTLINSWNSYLLPVVFLRDTSQQVVTLLPSFFVSEFTNDQTKVMAAAVVTAVPEIVAYICLQKYFERGLSAGALK
ncbi:MAG: carbohydrate ABC transporter permease [Propionibacteriaceae bacterium]|jgi:ABC-type glycerol-3-phosphate transport system permease component|nr:carbohydrate ABC transporter permease [Propionibacteriaceae bacterium]